MKKILLLFLLIAVAGCLGGPKILNKYPVPQDRPLYGVTPKGIFYLHKSLVENAQGKEPVFASDVTGFRGRRTHLKNDYYTYDANVIPHDQAQFDRCMKRNFMPIFIFVIGDGRQIPEILMDTEWIKPEDTVEDKSAGMVFRVWPKANPYLDDEPQAKEGE